MSTRSMPSKDSSSKDIDMVTGNAVAVPSAGDEFIQDIALRMEALEREQMRENRENDISFERKKQHSLHEAASFSELFRNSTMPLTTFAIFGLLCRARDLNESDALTGSDIRVRIPDTIVCGLEDLPFWLFTGNDGCIHRVDSVTSRTLFSKLSLQLDSDSIAAIQKRPQFSDGKNDITLLSARDFKVLIESPSSSQFLIQRFIQFRGPKASITRVDWSREHDACSGWAISNRKSVDDNSSGSDIKAKYCTSSDEILSLSYFEVKGAILSIPGKMCSEIVRAMDRHLPGRRVNRLIADFIRDEKGDWWFLQVKCYDTEKLPPRVKKRYTLLKEKMSKQENPHSNQSGLSSSTSRKFASGENLAPVSPLFMNRTSLNQSLNITASLDLQRNDVDASLEETSEKLCACRSCLAYYSPSELEDCLSLKMIFDMEQHLKKRGIHLDWFGRSEFNSTSNIGDWFQMHAVCRNCFDLFQIEERLATVEVVYAHVLGIPTLSDPCVDKSNERERTRIGRSSPSAPSNTTIQSNRTGDTRSARPVSSSRNFRNDPLQLASAALSGISNNVPKRVNPSDTSSNSHALTLDDRRRPHQLIMYRMAIFVHEIRGVGLGFEEEDVELRIHALESPFLVRFCQDSGEHFPSVIGPSDFSFQTFSSDDILTGSSPSVTEKMRILIGKLRVYHFFVEKHEDLFRFLSDTQSFRVDFVRPKPKAPHPVTRKAAGRADLASSSNDITVVGSCTLSLVQFLGGKIDKLDYCQLIESNSDRNLDLSMIRCSIAFDAYENLVDTSYVHLSKYSSILLPPTDYLFAQPVPMEWIEYVYSCDSHLEDALSNGWRQKLKSNGRMSHDGRNDSSI